MATEDEREDETRNDDDFRHLMPPRIPQPEEF